MAKKKTKREIVNVLVANYVTRNKELGADWCSLWRRKTPPKIDRYRGYTNSQRGYLRLVCYRTFSRITGLKLKPGECKEIRLVIESEGEK